MPAELKRVEGPFQRTPRRIYFQVPDRAYVFIYLHYLTKSNSRIGIDQNHLHTFFDSPQRPDLIILSSIRQKLLINRDSSNIDIWLITLLLLSELHLSC